jgi:hypothetical protein
MFPGIILPLTLLAKSHVGVFELPPGYNSYNYYDKLHCYDNHSQYYG